MQSFWQRHICTLLTVIFLTQSLGLTTPAQAESFISKMGRTAATCGLLFMAVGMISATVATTTVSGEIAKKQGAFESNQDYVERMERVPADERPYVLVTIASLSAGAALLVSGKLTEVIAGVVEASLPTRSQPFVIITDVPSGSSAQIDGQEIAVINGKISLPLKYLDETRAGMTSALTIISHGVTRNFKIQVIVKPPGEDFLLPFSVLKNFAERT